MIPKSVLIWRSGTKGSRDSVGESAKLSLNSNIAKSPLHRKICDALSEHKWNSEIVEGFSIGHIAMQLLIRLIQVYTIWFNEVCAVYVNSGRQTFVLYTDIRLSNESQYSAILRSDCVDLTMPVFADQTIYSIVTASALITVHWKPELMSERSFSCWMKQLPGSIWYSIECNFLCALDTSKCRSEIST